MTTGRPLSVVVPTVGRLPRLELALSCLRTQLEDGDEVVVVADGAPVPDVEAVAASALEGAAWRVRSQPRRGRAAARNAGARAGTGHGLLFLDDDVLVAGGSVAGVREGLAGGGAVTGRLLELVEVAWLDDPRDSRKLGPALAPTALRRTGFDAGSAGARTANSRLQLAVLRVGDGIGEAELTFLAAAGAFLAVDRATFAAHGGFDERFGTDWGCEDLELGLRLQRAGVPWRHLELAGWHMTHGRPGRAAEHERTLALFRRLHPIPAVERLHLLLGEDGSVDGYFDALATAQAVGGAS